MTRATRQMRQQLRSADYALRGRRVEDIDLSLAAVKGLPERMTVGDKALLLRAWSPPVDVETLVDVDLHQVLWLVHYKLLALWVDGADRVWIRTTSLGREIVKPSGKKRR